MEIVTGHRGTPHVTPYKVGDFQQGVVGSEDCVLDVGSRLEAHIVTNNRIDIKDGSICMQGRHAVIPKNINDELTIENGMQGEKRIDLIVSRYVKEPDTGIESIDTFVIQGTPSKGSPAVPEHVVGDIRNGDLKHEMPLYEVELNGINVTEVRPVFKLLCNMSELQKQLGELSKKGAKVISKDEFGTTIDTGYSRIRFGTAIRSATTDAGSNRYFKLWTLTEVASMLGLSKVEATRLGISVFNGDSGANMTHFYNPELWTDNTLYVYCWGGANGNLRINYRIEYPTIGL
jgi:hypothetical protein|nr:MAG TPA: hypothetical protein [Caudoviricetes sp.]